MDLVELEDQETVCGWLHVGLVILIVSCLSLCSFFHEGFPDHRDPMILRVSMNAAFYDSRAVTTH